MTSSRRLGLTWWLSIGGGRVRRVKQQEQVNRRAGSSIGVWGRVHRWISSIFAALSWSIFDLSIGGDWHLNWWLEDADLECVYDSTWMRKPKTFSAHGSAWGSLWWSKNLGFSDLEVKDWFVWPVCWKFKILWWQGFENEYDWWDLWGAEAKKYRGELFELYVFDTMWKTLI
jgi:hypothetical protein